MSSHNRRGAPLKVVMIAAMALGIAAGSYGIANAASGSGSGTKSSSSSAARSARSAQHPWGRQRSDETGLTGDTASKVRQAALAKVPGATIVRVETDADGHAAYEAHMVKSDGSRITVYVNKQFDVVGTESR